MENANASGSRGKKLLAGATVALVALGSVITYVGSGSGGLMSQFSGTSVTPDTASSLWQPSANNPKRAAVGDYAPRLDSLIRTILGRGTGLPPERFSAYLGNLSSGIRALGAKPEYLADRAIQDVIGYLAYELDDAAKALVSGNALYDGLLTVLNNTGWLAAVVGTSGARQGTSGNMDKAPATNDCGTVTAGGFSYPTYIAKNGQCWTKSNMKHGGKYENEGRVYYDYATAKSTDVCPALGADWHLPSSEEFINLITTSKATQRESNNANNNAIMLESDTDMGIILGNLHSGRIWQPKSNGASSNFPNGLSAGYNGASLWYWWSSTEGSSDRAYAAACTSRSSQSHNYLEPSQMKIGSQLSVVCVKWTPKKIETGGTTQNTAKRNSKNSSNNGDDSSNSGGATQAASGVWTAASADGCPASVYGDQNNWNCDPSSKRNPENCMKAGDKTTLLSINVLSRSRAGSDTASQKAYISAWTNDDVANLAFDDTAGVATWESSNYPQLKCKTAYAVDAVCGSIEGKPVLRDGFGKNTPDACAVWNYTDTVKPLTGNLHEYLIENSGDGFPTNPDSFRTANYRYTCEGLNGGKKAECKTGLICPTSFDANGTCVPG